MSFHRTRSELINTVEHSEYLPVLASLLIGFIIAWSIRQPGFQDKSGYENMHGAAPMIARELPSLEVVSDVAKEPAHAYGEFQDLIEEPAPEETVERNNKLPTPELFVKSTATDGGYLLSFSTNNFVVGTDGYLLLKKNDTTFTKIFASPYFLSEKDAKGTIHIVVANTEGKIFNNKGDEFSEEVSFE